MECAAVSGRPSSPFASLARRSGFSERDCRLAAAADPRRLLVGIIRAAELRDAQAARAAGRVAGALALARLRGLEGEILEGQLREAGLI